MIDPKEPIISKEELINENIYRAVSVYKFLISLPEGLARTVFKAVVDDSYEMAEIMDLDVAYESLARSLFESYYPDYLGDSKSIDQFIGATGNKFSDAVNEYIDRQYDGCAEEDGTLVKTLAGTLMEVHPEALPDRLNLVRAYPMFSIKIEDISESEGLLSRVENRLREGLRRIDGKYDRLAIDYPMDNHCFYPLAYLTLLYKWSMSQDHDIEMMSLVYRWYCKGEVLDYVLEAFKRARARTVVDKMWTLFTGACRTDQAFRDIFQERYDKIMGPISTHRFACEAEIVTRIAALDPIPIECGGSTEASEEIMDRLWEELGPYSSKPFVRCSQAEFRALFSGRSATVSKPLVWCGLGQELADFLVCCQGIRQQSNRKYIEERARPLFLNHKSGEPFEIITMKKSHKYEDNSMKRFFCRVGINRI